MTVYLYVCCFNQEHLLRLPAVGYMMLLVVDIKDLAMRTYAGPMGCSIFCR